MSREVLKSALIVGTISGLSQWWAVSQRWMGTVAEQFLALLWWDVLHTPYVRLVPFAGGVTIGACVLPLAYIASRHLDRVSHGEARSAWTFAFWGTTVVALAYPVFGFLRSLSPDSHWDPDMWPWTLLNNMGALSVCGGLGVWLCLARAPRTFWRVFSCYWAWYCVSSLLCVNYASDFI